jgi:hypothetical protein
MLRCMSVQTSGMLSKPQSPANRLTAYWSRVRTALYAREDEKIVHRRSCGEILRRALSAKVPLQEVPE